MLLEEILAYLKPKSGKHYVDGTVGAAGHTEAILAASQPKGTVLGLDRDPRAIAALKPLAKKYGTRLHLAAASYDQLPAVLAKLSWPNIDGILLDLGLSSTQLDDPSRGFGFRNDGYLDLRFDETRGSSAADYLAQTTESELANLLHTHGELYNSRGLARKIHEYARSTPIRTTVDLRRASGLAHPRYLAQLFQALRIAVNDELDILARSLPALWQCLAADGILLVISFHSGEDRIVKEAFRSFAKAGEGIILTKKPVVASLQEQHANPRSRSAKLRVMQKSIQKVGKYAHRKNK